MQLPALTLTTLQGEPAALRGDPPMPRLLVVYKRDCETCGLLLPAIERLSRSLHGHRLLTLGVSQSSADDTLDAINEHGLCFPQALDANGLVATALGIESVPALVLADGEGAIVARCTGLDAAALREVLLAAARLSSASEQEVGRAIEAFKLPESQPGSPVRPRP
jgi:peroxiredoxin